MKRCNIRRDETQQDVNKNIWVGQALPDNAPLEGHYCLNGRNNPYCQVEPDLHKQYRGFTLIELLVVVLIIGVLAAVALPQYQKAVLKSRFSNLMPIANAVAASNEVYYLGNGAYTANLANLDVEGQATYPGGEKVTLNVADDFTYVMAESTKTPNNKYIVYQKHSAQFPANIHCAALKNNTQAEWLCEKGLNGTPITGSIEEGYKMYILQGSASDGYYGTVYTNTNNKVLSGGDKCVATDSRGCNNTNATDGGVCVAKAEMGCLNSGSYTHSTYDNSTCIAEETAYQGCAGWISEQRQTYKNQSTCEGKGQYSCSYSNFTDSDCQGTGTNACKISNFSNSICEGKGYYSCGFSTFTNNSVCYASGMYSCSDNTYESGSYCAENGGHCPSGSPAQSGGCWDGSGNIAPENCSN